MGGTCGSPGRGRGPVGPQTKGDAYKGSGGGAAPRRGRQLRRGSGGAWTPRGLGALLGLGASESLAQFPSPSRTGRGGQGCGGDLVAATKGTR